MKKQYYLFTLALGLGLGTAFAGTTNKADNNSQLPQGPQKEEIKKKSKYTLNKFNVFKLLDSAAKQKSDSTLDNKIQAPKKEAAFEETTDLFDQGQKSRSFFKFSYAS
ncbi:MAG: hypothetical protein RIC95_09210 [Vicingaceae bacterium]